MESNEQNMEKENDTIINKKKEKCVLCSEYSFDKKGKSNPFVISFGLPELESFSEINNLDYDLVICVNCVLGLSFTAISWLTGEKVLEIAKSKDMGHSLISKAFKVAGEKYFLRTNQMRQRQAHGMSITE